MTSPWRSCIRCKKRGVSSMKVRVRRSASAGFGPGGRSSRFASRRVIASGISRYSEGLGESKTVGVEAMLQSIATR